MSGRSERSAENTGHARERRSAALTLLTFCTIAVAVAQGQERGDRHRQERLDDARLREGALLVRLADTAMIGRAESDFAIEWRNDFFKAQTGTFVPFTVTVERAKLSAASALMYVRAVRRDTAPPAQEHPGQVRYPFDLIFAVDLAGPGEGPLRITRGFAVPPGEYDVYVALRERASDPPSSGPRPKAAVLKQPLSVPDFWEGGLTTSSVILADRIDALPGAPAPDEVLERPYIIGENEIHPAADSSFRKDRELIVVFLIYNASVSAERNFDIQVDYHLFRTAPPGTAPEAGALRETEPAGDHPAARDGERYITHTNPQRFKPSLMGAHFDPEAGNPMMAGQGILLSSFQEGEYRLGITVTDLLSRQTLSRDVTFKVVGS
jgi:hypothetical protein